MITLQKEEEMRKEVKEKKGLNGGVITAGVVVALVVLIYLGASIFFRSHFYPNTTVNGIEAGGKSLSYVKDAIRSEALSYSLTIVERGGGLSTLTSGELGLSVNTDGGEIDSFLASQSGFGWVGALFRGNDYLSNIVSVDKSVIASSVKELPCMLASHITDTKDASYTFDGEKFVIVDEVYGTELSAATLTDAVADAALSLRDKLDLEAEKVYVQPEVLSDDPGLVAKVEGLNDKVDMTISYEVGEKIDSAAIAKWIVVSDSGSVSYDEDAIEEYVASLAKKYDTAGQSKTLKTSYGNTVTVKGGSYGWKIDKEGEKAEILSDLSAGEDVSRDFVYEYTAASHGANDYGDSYVEINLSAQHLFLYVNGSLVTQSDFVSGNVSKGNGTHIGAYRVTYTQKDAVLRGDDYETPVTFWMPFNGNEGMHDATWRSKFGGSIYKTSGSHGCVNLPYSAAQTIFSKVKTGFPVLVYADDNYTVGTQSAGADAIASLVSGIDAIGDVTPDKDDYIMGLVAKYNALTDSDKAQIGNYAVLQNAEMTIYSMRIGNAEAAINSIGGVTADSKALIDTAIYYVNAVPSVYQANISNLWYLNEAKAAYNAIVPGTY